MGWQGAGRPGGEPRQAAGTTRDGHRSTSIAPCAVAGTTGVDLATRVIDELGAHAIDWQGPLPALGATVRAPGSSKGRGNDATAITRTADGIVWFDHSSGTGGFVREGDTCSGRLAADRHRARAVSRVGRESAEIRERFRQQRAIELARRAWADATPCVSHPYLEAKKVTVARLRVDRSGRLLVPRRNAAGRLIGLQRIGVDGTKRYSRGTPTRGTFFGMGTVDADGTVLVVEGLATGATVHAETGHPTAVAFDTGNLRPVAELLRGRYPDVRIVLCADDDRQTADNPGRTKAVEAACAVRGVAIVPTLCRCCRCTDFNDLAQCWRRSR